MERRTKFIGGWGKRLTALVLCLVMAFSAFPVTAGADNTLKNTYVLRVDTGINPGTQVLYLGVRYLDDKDVERTEFVFPHERSLSGGYHDIGASVREKLALVGKVTGYNLITQPKDMDGLRANSTDYYIVSTNYTMKQFLALDVFMRYPGETGSTKAWEFNGFYFFKADRIYGLNMAGYYSDDYFVEFDGTLLAKLAAKNANMNIEKSDKCFRFEGSDIQTCNEPYSNHAAAPYYLKFDIADVYGSGVEALATEVKDKKSLKGMIEPLTASITYTDIFGEARYAELPVATSMATWAVEQKKCSTSLNIIGLCQQGESVIIPALLPDFASLSDLYLIYGQGAAAEAGIFAAGHNDTNVDATPPDTQSSRRAERLKKLENDSLMLAGMTFYPGTADVKLETVGAMLEASVSEKSAPLLYYTARTVSGDEVRTGETCVTGWLKDNYTPSTALEPPPSNSNFLVVIKTDEAEAAATTEDITIQVSYQAVGGGTKITDAISFKDATKNYNGYWPITDPKADGPEDASYVAAVCPGGTLAFTLLLNDVYAFTGVTLRMGSDSKDDWQMQEIAIYNCTEVGKRTAVWKDIGCSDRVFSRTNVGTSTSRIAAYPNDKERASGDYLKIFLSAVDNTRTITFNVDSNGTNTTSEDAPPVNWDEIKYSMTFREANQDLGFVRRAQTYSVQVHVADNGSANRTDGDCGSDNLFYFKFNFENGSSGYLLANQQLTADGFRAGQTETFSVITNEDYGNLISVSIIPEMDSESDNQDAFDKLNIDSIEVIQQSSISTSRTWRIENVGWIGIDYIEKGAESTVKGRPGKREGEIAQTHAVTSSGYSMNLLFTMTTGSYDRSASDVNYTPGSKNPAYEGSIIANITYLDTSGIRRSMSVDVAAAIAQYAERKAEYFTSADTDASKVDMLKAKVDPTYMMRENHTDSFVVTLQDVREIADVTLGLSSAVATRWKLVDLSIWEITSDGQLQITRNNEYKRTNAVNKITSSASTNGYDLQVFAPSHADLEVGPQQPLVVTFGEHKISFSDADGEWKPVIQRTPTTHNDILNIYIKLKDDSSQSPIVEKKKNKDGVEMYYKAYPMTGVIQYASNLDGKDHQIAFEGMPLGMEDEDDGMAQKPEENVFVVEGVSVPGFTMMRLVSFYANSRNPVTAVLDTVTIQHVRSGVVIGTYQFHYGSSDDTGSHTVTTDVSEMQDIALTSSEKPVVELFFTDKMNTQELQAQVNDLAVAIRYRTTFDPSGKVYTSSYVYLTDDKDEDRPGYTAITPGMVAELEFSENAVSEIVGLTMVKLGDFEAALESAIAKRVGYATREKTDLQGKKMKDVNGNVITEEVQTLLGWYNFAEPGTLYTTPRPVNTSETNVVPVKMTFVTKNQSAEILSSDSTNSKDAAIRMTVNYLPESGLEPETKVFEDIRTYLVDGSFRCGEEKEVSATIEFFMEDVAMIRSVVLEPYSTGPYSSAIWGLKSVYYTADFAGETMSHLTECTVKSDDGRTAEGSSEALTYAKITQGNPRAVNLFPVDTSFQAYVHNVETGVSTLRFSNDFNTAAIGAMPGQLVVIVPKITGQLDGYGFTVNAVRMIGSASQDVNDIEIVASLEETEETSASDTPAILFRAPANDTTAEMTYVITVASEEVPEEYASLTVVVGSGASNPNVNPVPNPNASPVKVSFDAYVYDKQTDMATRTNSGTTGEASLFANPGELVVVVPEITEPAGTPKQELNFLVSAVEMLNGIEADVDDVWIVASLERTEETDATNKPSILFRVPETDHAATYVITVIADSDPNASATLTVRVAKPEVSLMAYLYEDTTHKRTEVNSEPYGWATVSGLNYREVLVIVPEITGYKNDDSFTVTVTRENGAPLTGAEYEVNVVDSLQKTETTDALNRPAILFQNTINVMGTSQLEMPNYVITVTSVEDPTSYSSLNVTTEYAIPLTPQNNPGRKGGGGVTD